MQVGDLVARDVRHHRGRLTRVQRTPDARDLVTTRELRCRIHRLGRVALRVAHHELDLAPLDAARVVDLLDAELGAATDADAGRRAGSREGWQVADRDRRAVCDGWFENPGRGGCCNRSTARKCLAARNFHAFPHWPDSGTDGFCRPRRSPCSVLSGHEPISGKNSKSAWLTSPSRVSLPRILRQVGEARLDPSLFRKSPRAKWRSAGNGIRFA